MGQPVGQLYCAIDRQLRRFCQGGREVCLAFQIEVLNLGWRLTFWLKNRCGAKKVALKACARGGFQVALQSVGRHLRFVRADDVHFALLNSQSEPTRQNARQQSRASSAVPGKPGQPRLYGILRRGLLRGNALRGNRRIC